MYLNHDEMGRYKIPIESTEIEPGSVAIFTLCKLESQLEYREIEILKDLKVVKINHEVPAGYHILEFYDSQGKGFEAGKTPSGYSITS